MQSKVVNLPSMVISDKIPSQLLALTYGTFVKHLLDKIDSIQQVNFQLEKIGYKMGKRLVDQFLAKASMTRPCQTFKEVIDILGKHAFKMFLGVSAEHSKWSQDQKQCSLILNQNPLAEFVILPARLAKSNFNYSNLICGVIRGSLQALMMEVTCNFVQDLIRGDNQTEIRVRLDNVIQQKFEDDQA